MNHPDTKQIISEALKAWKKNPKLINKEIMSQEQ